MLTVKVSERPSADYLLNSEWLKPDKGPLNIEISQMESNKIADTESSINAKEKKCFY